ncbi:MAG: LEA type 2 family protein [Saprospiraceae bacterium]|nr:LEA type 2 family protein [Saprospiraceae bacterium]MBK7737019.1 LEA type 2 family protein [Saprospiraceae bacterium]MBK7914386.1 LEA type 2 family protein [Saprospiraceae bacterium]
MKNLLALIGIGAFGYWLFTSASKHISNNLSLDKATLSFGKVSLTGVPFTLNLHVRNNTSYALPLDAFSGYMTYGNNELAPINISSSVVIEPHRISIVSVKSALNLINLSSSIADIIKSGKYLQGVRIRGYLTVKGVDFPIDKEINPFA